MAEQTAEMSTAIFHMESSVMEYLEALLRFRDALAARDVAHSEYLMRLTVMDASVNRYRDLKNKNTEKENGE